MNISYLSTLAKEHPALARAIETAIACGFCYLIGIAVSGEAFSTQALITTILAPIYMMITKYKRDLEAEADEDMKKL